MDYEYRPGINATLAKLKAENKKLRAALKPFADIALLQDHDHRPGMGDMIDMPCFAISPRQVRAAREALTYEQMCAACGSIVRNKECDCTRAGLEGQRIVPVDGDEQSAPSCGICGREAPPDSGNVCPYCNSSFKRRGRVMKCKSY